MPNRCAGWPRRRAGPGPRPEILGAHLEGPFLGGKPGAHPTGWIVPVDRAWLDALPAGIAVLTLAPECPGAPTRSRGASSEGWSWPSGTARRAVTQVACSRSTPAPGWSPTCSTACPGSITVRPGVAAAALDRRPGRRVGDRRLRARPPRGRAAGLPLQTPRPDRARDRRRRLAGRARARHGPPPRRHRAPHGGRHAGRQRADPRSSHRQRGAAAAESISSTPCYAASTAPADLVGAIRHRTDRARRSGGPGRARRRISPAPPPGSAASRSSGDRPTEANVLRNRSRFGPLAHEVRGDGPLRSGAWTSWLPCSSRTSSSGQAPGPVDPHRSDRRPLLDGGARVRCR